MNKTDLIKAVSKKTGIKRAATKNTIDTMLKMIEESLTDGEKVVLVDFGTFFVKERAPRKGRNPQTMEEIMIPESKAPVFKPGKGLKDKVNS